MKRVGSIDFTRGLVMIIMALDHVRDMIHVDSIVQSPTNLATTTPALFFTRWITYLCAPIFVFLAGTSAYITFRKKNNMAASRAFLIRRGLWLIVLELTLVNFALFFDIGFHTFLFEVIAAIGFGFIALGLLIRLQPFYIGAIGLIIILCHGLFSMIPFADGSVLRNVLAPLFTPNAFPLTPHTVFIMGYPPLPWLGIMLAGFACGKFFEWEERERQTTFLKIGFGALLLFAIVRFANGYGDFVPWSTQKDGVYTFLSFMNITKYPPSLLFCAVTLGIMFLILALADRTRSRIVETVSVYGKVPMFYFLVHFYLIHVILLVVLSLQGFQWADLSFAGGTFGRPSGPESGLELWAVYLLWISVVLGLYSPCRWFGKYKADHKQFWLKYI